MGLMGLEFEFGFFVLSFVTLFVFLFDQSHVFPDNVFF